MLRAGRGELSCRILDYSSGGLLVSLGNRADSRGGAPSPLRIEEGVRVLLGGTGSLGGGRAVFLGRVVRIDGERAGIAFMDPRPADLKVLREQAAALGRAFARRRETTSGRSRRPDLIAELNRIFRDGVGPAMARFQESVVEELFEAGKASSDLRAQNAYFEVMGVIKANRQSMRTGFAEAIQRHLQSYSPYHGPEPETEEELDFDQLSLVDDEEFDSWLSVSDIVTAVESAQRETLSCLEQRLSEVFGASIDRTSNPYGPDAVCRAFQEVIEDLGMTHAAAMACYPVLKQEVLRTAAEVYPKLDRYLKDSGVLPDLKYQVVGVAPESSRRRESPRVDPEPAQGEGRRESAALVEPNTPAQPPGERSFSLRSGAEPPPRAGVAQVPREASTDIYRIVGDLRSVRARLGEQAVRVGGPARPGRAFPTAQAAATSPAAATTASYFSPADLLQVLSDGRWASRISTRQTAGRDLKEVVEEALAAQSWYAPERAIGAREGRILEVANDVFGALVEDSRISQSVRSWIRRLEVPLLKMALVDDDLFQDRDHVARQVVNKLAELELLAEMEDREEQKVVKRAFEWLVDLLGREFDGTTKVFERASEQLDFLQKLQQRAFDARVEKVTTEFLGQEGPATEAGPSPAEGEELQDPWLRKVRRLEKGSWVLLDLDSEEPRRLRVAMISPRSRKILLVSAVGDREDVLEERQLADSLRDGQAVVLDREDQPAMDRAQYAMLQNLHAELLRQSTHDDLTGLVNRREFLQRIESALSDARANGTRHAVCWVDIDNFHLVNNACGYEGGDILLRQVAGMLGNNLARGSVLARLGSDEFGILLREHPLDDALEVVEDQLADMHEFRFQWAQERMSVMLSVGLVPLTQHSESASGVLQEAESSCGLANELGGNRIQIHHPGRGRLSRRKEEMQSAVRLDKALDEGLLYLRCQRIVPIQEYGDRESHYEILLGLDDRIGKEMSLFELISAAERYHRMIEVDRWVIRSAFDTLGRNLDRLAEVGGVSINLSGPSLNDGSLVEFIREQAAATGVPMSKICFEITETAGISNLSDAVAFIDKVKETGCMFSLDDFGSGMSSYGYLKNLPIDFLKIDGAFVKELKSSASDYAVVMSICEIGHFMGNQIIAECVEDEESLKLLQEIGVNYGQGYYLEKPRPLIDLLPA